MRVWVGLGFGWGWGLGGVGCGLSANGTPFPQRPCPSAREECPHLKGSEDKKLKGEKNQVCKGCKICSRNVISSVYCTENEIKYFFE